MNSQRRGNLKVGAPTRIYDPLFSTPAMTEVLSAETFVRNMLLFERALSAALEERKVIPNGTAQAIAALSVDDFDLAVLAAAARSAGNLCIPFVKMLTAEVARSNSEAAGYVHWGATSQDVIDTATMLQVRAAITLLEEDMEATCDALASLIRIHQNTVMSGRTWLQQGPPVTLGLKLATLLDALDRHRDRLQHLMQHAIVLQLGGAVGTLAALGRNGPAVAENLGRLLNLPVPAIPWHTQRDRIGEIAATLGILVGTLGKFGRDTSLLMQTEVGEFMEPSAPGRGGSSTMPHKRNPIFSAVILAASTRVPGLVGTLLSAMVQEHERGLGGWHAEWETLIDILRLTGGALAATREIVCGAEIYPAAMQCDMALLGGVTMAEALSFRLAQKVGKGEAHRIAESASRRAVREGINMRDALLQEPAVAQYFAAEDFNAMLNPDNYLGASNEFIERVLANHSARSVEVHHATR